MKNASMLCMSFFLCSIAGANALAEEKHSVAGVIKMLQDLKQKAIGEGKAEAAEYAKFTHWCSTSTSEVKSAISDEKANIEQLGYTVSGLSRKVDSLTSSIKGLGEQILAQEGSGSTAASARESEAALFRQSHQDFTSTISAVEEALGSLKTAKGPVFLQQSISKLIGQIGTKTDGEEIQALTDFVATTPDVQAKGDAAAHVDQYNFKSNNVIDLMNSLKLKFQDKKVANVNEETNSANSYTLAKQARDNAIEALRTSKTRQEGELGSAQGELSTAQESERNDKADLEADSNRKATAEESCSTKKTEWETRSKTRSNEVASLDAAVSILGKATGLRTQAPNNPVLGKSPVELLLAQVGQKGLPASDPKMKAIALIRAAAKADHSQAMDRLAVELSSHLNGPFDDMNGMIQKMIFRLMKEQTDEDSHKLWCDKEMEKTGAMKDNKFDKVNELQIDIDVETSAVSKLTSDIENANKMISDISSFIREATEIRSAGKNENKQAIKDASEAQGAIANAIATLGDFYKESGAITKEAYELIQKQPVQLPENPATWDSSYTGVSRADGQPAGIVAVLSNLNAQFSRMEAETKSQETVDQQEFQTAMQANTIEKARRAKEVEMKEAEKKRHISKNASLSSKKKSTASALEKTEQYLADLKPACTDGDSSYEARKGARSDEIASLKTAQTTLADAFKVKSTGSFLQIRPAM